jgi:hypothetical protein
MQACFIATVTVSWGRSEVKRAKKIRKTPKQKKEIGKRRCLRARKAGVEGEEVFFCFGQMTFMELKITFTQRQLPKPETLSPKT